MVFHFKMYWLPQNARMFVSLSWPTTFNTVKTEQELEPDDEKFDL